MSAEHDRQNFSFKPGKLFARILKNTRESLTEPETQLPSRPSVQVPGVTVPYGNLHLFSLGQRKSSNMVSSAIGLLEAEREPQKIGQQFFEIEMENLQALATATENLETEFSSDSGRLHGRMLLAAHHGQVSETSHGSSSIEISRDWRHYRTIQSVLFRC